MTVRTATRRIRSAIAKPNACAMRGLTNAMAELYSTAPGLVGEDALAERERVRREVDALNTRQQVLCLKVTA